MDNANADVIGTPCETPGGRPPPSRLSSRSLDDVLADDRTWSVARRMVLAQWDDCRGRRFA